MLSSELGSLESSINDMFQGKQATFDWLWKNQEPNEKSLEQMPSIVRDRRKHCEMVEVRCHYLQRHRTKRRTKMLKAWRQFNWTIKENTAKTKKKINMFQWSQASLMCKDIRSSTNVFFASKKKFLPRYQRRSSVHIVPLKFSQDSPSNGSSGSNDWTSVQNKHQGYETNVAGLSVNRNDRRTKEILISKDLNQWIMVGLHSTDSTAGSLYALCV